MPTMLSCPSCGNANSAFNVRCGRCGESLPDPTAPTQSHGGAGAEQSSGALAATHLRPGDRVAHYVLVREIGRGGMGVVFRARDERLLRDVAIKILPTTVAAHPLARDRLLQEARAAAALDDPAIATVHEIGEHHGEFFIVMALYRGQTLRALLDAKGRLPLAEAAAIALGVARGLAAAHAAGIVHRDIKPANIFVTDTGEVRILDFGLAQVAAERPGSACSAASAGAGGLPAPAPRAIVGTVAYMAPEQARGDEVGPRGDVFSFGMILHEMLCGHRPVSGGGQWRVAAEVPESLRHVVSICLQAPPASRYGSGAELLAALRATAPPPAAPPAPLPRRLAWRWAVIAGVPAVIALAGLHQWHGIDRAVADRGGSRATAAATGVESLTTPSPATSSLAALPSARWRAAIGVPPFFVSSELAVPEREAVGQLAAEYVVAILSDCPGFRVPSVDSAAKGGGGAEVVLGVALSPRDADNGVDISARLTHVAGGAVVWSRDISVAPAMFTDGLERLARELALWLAPELAPDRPARLRLRPAGLSLFVRVAEMFSALYDADDDRELAVVERQLVQHLAGDPSDALAAILLADHLLENAGEAPSAPDLSALTSTTKAGLGAAPNLAGVLGAAACAAYSAGRHDEAYALFTRALARNPEHADANACFAELSAARGLLGQALRHADIAVETDTGVAEYRHERGWLRFLLGEHAGAASDYAAAANLGQDSAEHIAEQAMIAALSADHAAALSLLARVRARSPAVHAEYYPIVVAASDPDTARRLPPSDDPYVLIVLGRTDEALEALDAETSEDPASFPYEHLQLSPVFGPVRDQPLFSAIVQKQRVRYERARDRFGYPRGR
ncbi:MAG: protein kinase [Candidatus Schekmanbacteria bacterium]|nr:protein kinase [Candidatus Schekmanbacteria bacterium]